jgi:hypothetical protein
MDQNIRSKGALLSSIILSGSAIMAFGLGLSMAASYPDKIWWVGLLLLVCGLLLSYSAVSIYRSAKREKKISDEQIAVINDVKRGKPSDTTKIQILANWLYTISEWKQFMKWEKRKNRSNTIIEAIVLTIVIALGMHYWKEMEWEGAIIISIIFGLIYGFIKYLVNLASIRLDENKMPEVLITNEAVIVNGHMNRFYGNNLWLGKVTVSDAGSFNVLEITYCWYTRSGQSFDEIRVPIPKGSLKEAIFLQERLMDEKKLIEKPH